MADYIDDDLINKYRDFNKAVSDISTVDPTSPNYNILKDRLNSAREALSNTMLKKFGVDDTNFLNKLDFKKPLTAEGQLWSDANGNPIAGRQGDIDNLSRWNKGQQDFLTKVVGDSGLDKWFEENDPLAQQIVDSYNKYGTIDPTLVEQLKSSIKGLKNVPGKILDKLIENWKSVAALIIFLSLGGAGWLKNLANAIENGLCNLGNAQSGCFWSSSDGSQTNVPVVVLSSNTDCTVKHCCDCGTNNCNDASCCNITVDADAKSHANGSYQYVCQDPLTALYKTVSDLLPDPTNILGTLEKVGIVIGIIVAVVIVVMIINFLRETFGGGHNEHLEISTSSSHT